MSSQFKIRLTDVLNSIDKVDGCPQQCWQGWRMSSTVLTRLTNVLNSFDKTDECPHCISVSLLPLHRCVTAATASVCLRATASVCLLATASVCLRVLSCRLSSVSSHADWAPCPLMTSDLMTSDLMTGDQCPHDWWLVTSWLVYPCTHD